MTDVARVQRTLAGAGDIMGVIRAVSLILPPPSPFSEAIAIW